MVALLPVAWVVVTPFAAAALIAGSARAHRLVAGHLTALVALGWLGVAMLAAGAFAAGGPARALLLALGAPLAGLSFWTRGGGGDDRRDDPDPEPFPPPDEIDWERFLADLERWRRASSAASVSRWGSGSRSPTTT